MDTNKLTRIFSCAIVGGVVGYWFRPSLPLVGQLPFSTVITRGANLNGLDLILKGVAEQSFNYLFGGLLLGAAAAFVWPRLKQMKSPESSER